MKHRIILIAALALTVTTTLMSGCVSVKAPERINITGHPDRIDSDRVPHTSSHEEARRLLADAYARNRYLEKKVRDLEEDNEKLEDERDAYKRRYEQSTD